MLIRAYTSIYSVKNERISINSNFMRCGGARRCSLSGRGGLKAFRSSRHTYVHLSIGAPSFNVSPASFAPVTSSAPFLLEPSSSALSPLLAFLLPSPYLIPSRSAWSMALRSGENTKRASLRAGLYFVANHPHPHATSFSIPSCSRQFNNRQFNNLQQHKGCCSISSSKQVRFEGYYWNAPMALSPHRSPHRLITSPTTSAVRSEPRICRWLQFQHIVHICSQSLAFLYTADRWLDLLVQSRGPIPLKSWQSANQQLALTEAVANTGFDTHVNNAPGQAAYAITITIFVEKHSSNLSNTSNTRKRIQNHRRRPCQ
jgi:hypothetical protein